MSTTDVPGFKASNGDELSMGSWAEHEDGSRIFVESTENNIVVFSVFDRSKAPVIEYRDAMPIADFKKGFSFGGLGGSTEKWTWHDKTPFPWDEIMADVPSGPRIASGMAVLTAAERIALSMNLMRRGAVDATRVSAMAGKTRTTVAGLWSKIQRAINELKA